MYHSSVETTVASFGPTYGKTLATFISTSGHTFPNLTDQPIKNKNRM